MAFYRSCSTEVRDMLVTVMKRRFTPIRLTAVQAQRPWTSLPKTYRNVTTWPMPEQPVRGLKRNAWDPLSESVCDWTTA